MFAKLSPLLAAALTAIAFAASATEPTHRLDVVGHAADPALVERYVQKVSAGSRDEPVSRWRDPICPLVSGLSREQAELMLQRLSEIAVQVGAPLGQQDCRPNLYIVATKTPKAMIRDWINRRDGLFASATTADIDRFIQTDRPVRVWRNVSSAGRDHIMTNSSQALFGTQGNASKPVLNWANDSHISSSATRDIWGVAVVLDPGIDKVKLGQLADYIAMVSFAGVKLDADLDGDPTILSLFKPGAAEAPHGLSNKDAAYLKALYAVPPQLVQQRLMIARHMTEQTSR